ncbi:MAG: DUF6572 domain-containing protein [Zavarzinella sp.]
MASEAPIQNIDQIDIVGKRKDGGVDLVIVASSPVTASPEHQQLLLDKIQSYLEQCNSPGFRDEFGYDAKVRILINFSQQPDPVIVELLKRSASWVLDNNAELAAKVGH